MPDSRLSDSPLIRSVTISLIVFLLCSNALAEDDRTQYPRFLSNSYVGLNVGYIDYRFQSATMQPGFDVHSVSVPHLAVGALLFGHEFNKYISAQVSYTRPVQWVEYQNVNGDGAAHSVWMNIAGLTAKARLPLTNSLSVYAEGGFALVTRKGFEINGAPAITNANFGSVLIGSGLQYRLSNKWAVVAGIDWSPAHSEDQQPSTSFYSAGFRYTMRPLSADQVARNSNTGWIFPKQFLQAGFVTNALGYGVNDFFSRGAVPIFWAADVQTASGFSLNYVRNIFHTRRTFSLDWGGGATFLKGQRDEQRIATASLYPLLRWTIVRTTPLDFYFNYSLAGPTYISRTMIDGNDTGRHFTFQDFMGIGVFLGRKKRTNGEIRISHFSNGNIFPANPGVTVPLTLIVGRTF